MPNRVNTVCRSAYFHLRNICSIRNMLTDTACSQLTLCLLFVYIKGYETAGLTVHLPPPRKRSRVG